MENSLSARRPEPRQSNEVSDWIAELDDAAYAHLDRFLRKRAGRRIATAGSHVETAAGVQDLLNSYGLPPSGRELPTQPPAADALRHQLPPQRPLPEAHLQEALDNRRSCYSFADSGISLNELADLLSHTARIYRRDRAGTAARLPLSNTPSAGGFNAISVYVVAARVERLRAGVYRYDRLHHHLDTVHYLDDAVHALTATYGQSEFATRAPATLVLTAQLHESVGHYGPRHYRTLHLDAGILLQNLYLVCTALRLNGCAVSGYRDPEASTLVAASDSEIVMALFPVGRPR